MNIGPAVSVSSSAAGAPLSQTAGAESERAQKDAAAQARRSDADVKAADAAGIGQTEEDQQTSERDADGRRLWEDPTQEGTAEGNEAGDAGARQRLAKDPSGASGNTLDLTG